MGNLKPMLLADEFKTWLASYVDMDLLREVWVGQGNGYDSSSAKIEFGTAFST